jgi:hypothetical protein
MDSEVFQVSVDIPGDASIGDSDTVTVTVDDGTKTSYDVVITTTVSCDIYYDDDDLDAQLGCSKGGKGPCYMGSVFTANGAIAITNVKAMFSSGGGTPSPAPFRVCFYDATVAGGPTGAVISCEGPFSADDFDVWYEVDLATPVNVDGDFAVALDQTGNFLSLGMDTDSDVGRAWASTDDGSSWTTVGGLGFPGNFMLRASFCPVVDDDDDDDDDDDNDDNDDNNDDNDVDDDNDDADDDDNDADDDTTGDDDDDDSGCGC